MDQKSKHLNNNFEFNYECVDIAEMYGSIKN